MGQVAAGGRERGGGGWKGGEREGGEGGYFTFDEGCSVFHRSIALSLGLGHVGLLYCGLNGDCWVCLYWETGVFGVESEIPHCNNAAWLRRVGVYTVLALTQHAYPDQLVQPVSDGPSSPYSLFSCIPSTMFSLRCVRARLCGVSPGAGSV